jgi:K+/H+ antiporter YhaU regulatory subunit KhtT
MIPVKGHVGLYRDENTSAIINNNDKEYNEYIQSRDRLLENQNKIQKIEEEISEIKNLLKLILEK